MPVPLNPQKIMSGTFRANPVDSREQQQMITTVKTGKRSDKRWTPEEDKQLLALFDAAASWPLIAITLERGVEGVQDRARKLRHEVE
jgi:hypothetical protein